MAEENNTASQPIKQENDNEHVPLVGFDQNEHIDLMSDNESDSSSVFKKPTKAASAQQIQETMTEPTATENSQTQSLHDQIVAKRKRLADDIRTRMPVAASPPVEEPEDDIVQRYERAKAERERRKAAREPDVIAEFEYIRLEAEYSEFKRKKQADDEYDNLMSAIEEESEGLFVDMDESVPEAPFDVSDNDEDGNDDDELSPPKRGRKRAAAGSDDETGPRKRKRTGTTKPKKVSKVPGQDYTHEELDHVMDNGKKKSRAKVPVLSKAKPRSRKQPGHNISNVASVWGTDVIRDAQANQDAADQPTFSIQNNKKRRDAALKQLIASVPADSAAVANNDKRFLDKALKSFTGHGSIAPAEDGQWLVKGMKTTLKHYQVLGVAFMRERENAQHPPKGGILADEMGLGKTIMCLANIVNGKPTDNAKVKTTLIVASPSLVGQWQDEIRVHCQTKRESKHGIGLVFQHRAGKRMHSNQDDEVLSSADIVLTTYQEVMKSYPKFVPPPQLTTAAQKDAAWQKIWEEDRGILHRVKWLRVVLDEASAIKNHKSQTSLACRTLESKHYWAISGTPVQNTLQEFYPYFKFLKEPTTGSFKIFRENYITEDDSTGKERLNAMLRKIMIRRTHIDRLFNARLLDLPTPHQHTIWLEFNDVERKVYDIVRRRFIEKINTMASNAGPNGMRKKFSHVWTMVLRLRQICASVLLIFESCLPLLEREDFEKLNAITTEEDDMSDEGVSLLLHLRNVLRNSHDTQTIEGGMVGAVITENEAVATGIVDVDQNIEGETGGKHGTSYRIRKYLDAFRHTDAWDEVVANTLCCGCRSPPYEPYVTSCSHIFCHGCLKDLQRLAAKRGHDMAKCAECGEPYTWSKPCQEGFESMQARPTSASGSDVPTKNGKAKKKESEVDWLGLKGEILPSAKTMAVKAQVLEWFSEDPQTKIILYTQFLPFLRILSKICVTEKWGYCTYSGKMSTEARETAINEFSNDPERRILLASLKCGGLGLNITAASRVILVDPWWNQAVEQQAFCRVFRIGQTKTTRMTRLVIKNTVDQAMQNLKERKRIEIDEVMSSEKLTAKLDVRDLMRLFNPVGEDENGRPFIYPDEEVNDGAPRLSAEEDEEEGHMGNDA